MVQMAQHPEDDRIICSIEKLADFEHYKAWYVDITVGLKALGLLGHINGQSPSPGLSHGADKLNEWNHDDTRAVRFLLLTIARELKRAVFENGWTEETTALKTLELIRDSAAEVSETTVEETIRVMFFLDPRKFDLETLAEKCKVRWTQIKTLYPDMKFKTFISLAQEGVIRRTCSLCCHQDYREIETDHDGVEEEEADEHL